MKTETLTKIAIASVLGMPVSCGVERGVVAYKQDLPEEKALYVNVLGDDNTAKKIDEESDAFFTDRKLFFRDQSYVGPFNFVSEGDTISYRNLSRATYLEMSKKNKILEIKCVRGR